ncbi:MiaB-like tRNA modifying enzyme, archaeal-type [Ostreococcus tauri]|uniref:Threonylcarbamoyladenosine tRNA methylthiotransferase n=1 Tax=Ostreococcus tauri TaxID=70448 RepID=A0A090M3A3_OSTTA|nr:MiaB-like tRNA modifying enzyme, archaeal-type [Ostreococcus tauri]CEF97152.1 MiaB-like tRNA modifying enzyme, archaeal-type [Ostreococcus tauri]|eukprot:XP_003078211.2 MiaB-like tRNA modifying enzyme, archaeal-type [Ostreococcus tauri]
MVVEGAVERADVTDVVEDVEDMFDHGRRTTTATAEDAVAAVSTTSGVGRSARTLEPTVNVRARRREGEVDDRGGAEDDETDETGGTRPGRGKIFVHTFGCSHNHSDSEFMAGQLQSYGYELVKDASDADGWLVNTCTVKNPSQSAMNTVLERGKAANKALLVAGCVPQGDKGAKELKDVSLLGVTQIDRVVEAMERTLAGDTVRMLEKKTLPRLDLPKVRRNEFVEILPLSTGCLGACTYCKTKHARGDLGSYEISALVSRVEQAISEGVSEVWLSSEDTGAYGIDLGTDVAALFRAITAVLPTDGSVMLRLGMTNPPYILAHLDAVAEAMRHPAVYAWMHIPVQSGSNAVLEAMKREYTVEEFRTVCDTLLEAVPGMVIATDVICGFPGETDEQWRETMQLIEEYKFPEVHISQFYPRPGTPAARMKRVPTQIVKGRSRELTVLFESYQPHQHLVGKTERVWVSDIARDGTSLVAHTKNYTQILLPGGEDQRAHLMGRSAMVEIYESSRWSCKARVLEVIDADPTVARVRLSVIPSEEESKMIREKLTKGKRVRIKKAQEMPETGCSVCGSDSSCPSSKEPVTARYLSVETVLIAGTCIGAISLACALYARNRRN